MEVKDLYSFVLSLVLIGIILGVGLLVLGQLMSTPNLPSVAVDAINETMQAIATIPSTWLGLIVTIVVVAILITLVVRSFFITESR